MTRNFRGPSLVLGAIVTVFALFPTTSDATVVEFETAMGTFEVNLYDNATPATVANFLNYVNNGAYTNSIFHRSPPGFVVQGGGFTYGLALPLNAIPANPAIVNEPEFSNVRGTIAMAKTNDPNSATNQWFFNLTNNSANLDVQNSGFTVFGEVVNDGMVVIDAIAALPIYNFSARFSSGAFEQLPLRDYDSTDFANNVTVSDDHLVMISAIIISDSAVDSAAGLNPTPNTLINQPPPPPPPPPSSGGGGGSFGFLMLFGLLLLTRVNLTASIRR